MNITHVIRGNEYIPSTPKYVLLYEAFNWEIPTFVHLPLIYIIDSEGKEQKLSKRFNCASFEGLIEQGYLPDAILNYIVKLGWRNFK
jgi:glutamyl-tRNA synthetase